MESLFQRLLSGLSYGTVAKVHFIMVWKYEAEENRRRQGQVVVGFNVSFNSTLLKDLSVPSLSVPSLSNSTIDWRQSTLGSLEGTRTGRYSRMFRQSKQDIVAISHKMSDIYEVGNGSFIAEKTS